MEKIKTEAVLSKPNKTYSSHVHNIMNPKCHQHLAGLDFLKAADMAWVSMYFFQAAGYVLDAIDHQYMPL